MATHKSYYINRSRSIANEFVDVYYSEGIEEAKKVLIRRLTGTMNILKRATIEEIQRQLGDVIPGDLV
jgi:hypothetical protein